MGIHVTVGEAEKRLAERVAAALRGEEVVLGDAGGRVRLVSEEPPPLSAEERERIGAQRRAAFGMWRKEFEGFDTSLAALKADRVDADERWRRTSDAAVDPMYWSGPSRAVAG
jgi:hypothetical protein